MFDSITFFTLIITSISNVYWCKSHPHNGEISRASNENMDIFDFSQACVAREYNFTATVTDRNGRKCSGPVQTKACFGMCESYEIGTFQFPWILRVQPVCNYAETISRVVRLKNCEPGADREAMFYRFPEAISCACQICDKKTQLCEPVPTVPPEIEDEIYSENLDDTQLSHKNTKNDYGDHEQDLVKFQDSILLQKIGRHRHH